MSEKNNFSVTVVNSYSQALYELAIENKSIDLIETQVNAVIELITQSSDFRLLIKDPTHTKDTQINVVNLIAEKFEFNELLKKFMNFLIIKRRFFNIKKILKDFLVICSNKRGEIHAKLTVAKKLNDQEIEKIKLELTQNFGSNIKLDYKYDPNLIGGLIIQIGSVMVDTSIKNKLQKIQNQMIGA